MNQPGLRRLRPGCYPFGNVSLREPLDYFGFSLENQPLPLSP
jgi:hypothetical protein